MTVTYRDELGLISLEADSEITFCGTEVCFEDIFGIDHKLDVQHLVSIVMV